MSAFRLFASLSLAALVGSGAAFAQSTARDNPDNPHSTMNKDRPDPGNTSNTQLDAAETGNSNSVQNKDKRGPAGKPDMDAAESGNPHDVKNKDRMSMESGPVTAQGVLDRMATADRGEVEMGKLAQANGSARVQQYGQMLEKDHGQALADVKDLAQKKNLTLADMPKDAMAMHEMKEAHEMHGKLAKLHGADFDKAFAKAMVDDHRKDIDHLTKWRTSVNDADVTALIDKTLPVLEKHLSAAQQLRAPAAQGRSPDKQ